MNKNTFVVSLINLKEKTFDFYENWERFLRPLGKGLLALAVLLITEKMFPYQDVKNLGMILAALAVLQAFLPLSVLYYIVSGLILFELWKVSFDIFAAFVLIIMICAVGYFRLDGHYSFITAIVPVLFYCKVGIAAPVALAIAFGMEALFPTLAGVVVYYFSVNIINAGAVLGGGSAAVGLGLQHVLSSMITDKEFPVVLVSTGITILVTCLLRKAFYERAWLVASTLGNTIMAFLVLAGCVYFDIEIQAWVVISLAVLGIVLCLLVEFFRGIGDVSRTEKTVFEDNEYIYYVKAVPKLKVSQSEPSVINMNESLYDEDEEEDDEDEAAESPEYDLEEDALVDIGEDPGPEPEKDRGEELKEAPGNGPDEDTKEGPDEAGEAMEASAGEILEAVLEGEQPEQENGDGLDESDWIPEGN